MKTATKHTDILDAWLERVEADESWSMRVEHTGATVTGYLINCRLAVVVRYAENLGWELLVAGSYQNSTEATLDGAAEALGVEGCRGLVPAEGGA